MHHKFCWSACYKGRYQYICCKLYKKDDDDWLIACLHSLVNEAMYLGKIATRGFLNFCDYLDHDNDEKMVPPSFRQQKVWFLGIFKRKPRQIRQYWINREGLLVQTWYAHNFMHNMHFNRKRCRLIPYWVIWPLLAKICPKIRLSVGEKLGGPSYRHSHGLNNHKSSQNLVLQFCPGLPYNFASLTRL